MTPTSRPSRSRVRTVLAYGSPVRSTIGKASMSARIIRVGPAPFFSSPTTPLPPTPSVTSSPLARSRSAIFPAVRFSSSDSSGFACRSR